MNQVTSQHHVQPDQVTGLKRPGHEMTDCESVLPALLSSMTSGL